MQAINEKIHTSNLLMKTKSEYFLRKIFENLNLIKLLEIVRYNKRLQNILNKPKNDYIEIYFKIEIELIPQENKYGTFIHFRNDTSYYHIFFNDNNDEIFKTCIKKEDKAFKIKIIIDKKVNSLSGLFEDCKCIKKINFKRFNRENINNMSYMFSGCSSLISLNLSKFNTKNVKNMSWMFNNCSALKKLNVSNFNTSNVTNMRSMFNDCSLLKELNLSNFNTEKVKNMMHMFRGCDSLKELNLSNFNINNVTNMNDMISFSFPSNIICSDEFRNKFKKFN